MMPLTTEQSDRPTDRGEESLTASSLINLVFGEFRQSHTTLEPEQIAVHSLPTVATDNSNLFLFISMTISCRAIIIIGQQQQQHNV